MNGKTKKKSTAGAAPTALLRLLAIGALVIIIFYAMFSSASDRPSARSYEADKLALQWMAQDRVKEVLREPDSAQFSGMISKPTTQAGQGIVCGYVRSRNGFGGMAMSQRFIVMDARLYLIEEQTTPEQMLQQWRLLCTR